MITSHIRRPLRRARGSQWYRDKGDRSTGTWCGAPDTRDDVQNAAWEESDRDWLLAWLNSYGPHEVCTKCIRAKEDGVNANHKRTV
jgi:hypothetical protein